MDRRFVFWAVPGEIGESGYYPVFERRRFCCLFGTEEEPNGAALHVNDRVVTIFASGRGSQSQNIFGFDLSKDTLKRKSRQVVAFVNNDVSIIRNKILNLALSVQALDHSNVDGPRSLVLASSKLPYAAALPRGRARNAATPEPAHVLRCCLALVH